MAVCRHHLIVNVVVAVVVDGVCRQMYSWTQKPYDFQWAAVARKGEAPKPLCTTKNTHTFSRIHITQVFFLQEIIRFFVLFVIFIYTENDVYKIIRACVFSTEKVGARMHLNATHLNNPHISETERATREGEPRGRETESGIIIIIIKMIKSEMNIIASLRSKRARAYCVHRISVFYRT